MQIVRTACKQNRSASKNIQKHMRKAMLTSAVSHTGGNIRRENKKKK